MKSRYGNRPIFMEHHLSWYEILFGGIGVLLVATFIGMMVMSIAYEVKNCEQWATVKTGATVCDISADGRTSRCEEETMLKCVAWKQPPKDLPAEAP